MATRTTAKLLRTLKADDASFAEEWSTLCDRSLARDPDVEAQVREVVRRVREEGDAAVIALIKQATGAQLTALEVKRDEWDEGCESVDPSDRAAIGKAAMRIRQFHRKRVPSSWEIREEGGAYMGQRVRPLDRVGVYNFRGESVRPSSVIMNVTPASVVEVPEIILATAPDRNGKIAPEILMAEIGRASSRERE